MDRFQWSVVGILNKETWWRRKRVRSFKRLYGFFDPFRFSPKALNTTTPGFLHMPSSSSWSCGTIWNCMCMCSDQRIPESSLHAEGVYFWNCWNIAPTLLFLVLCIEPLFDRCDLLGRRRHHRRLVLRNVYFTLRLHLVVSVHTEDDCK